MFFFVFWFVLQLVCATKVILFNIVTDKKREKTNHFKFRYTYPLSGVSNLR